MSVHEVIDSRVLGAFRLLDNPTQAVVKRPLNVSASNTQFIRNRSYHYIISTTAGLEHHTQSFINPPLTPDIGDVPVSIHVHDPMHRYLPRVTSMALPRDPNPDHAALEGSLFNAVAVQMYAAPTFPMHPNWSGIRASLVDANDTDAPIRGALLRVIRTSDDEVLARGYSDRRGEALIIIPGIPITNFAVSDEESEFDASGPVVISETSVRVEVIVDDTLPWPIDPEFIEAHRDDWLREGDEPILLTLRTGQIETININVDLT